MRSRDLPSQGENHGQRCSGGRRAGIDSVEPAPPLVFVRAGPSSVSRMRDCRSRRRVASRPSRASGHARWLGKNPISSPTQWWAQIRDVRRSADHPFPFFPINQVTKKMDKKKQDKHSRVKTFIKTVNYNHLMPTRYTLDVDLKATVTPTRWRTRRRRLPRVRRPRRFWRRGSRLASLVGSSPASPSKRVRVNDVELVGV